MTVLHPYIPRRPRSTDLRWTRLSHSITVQTDYSSQPEPAWTQSSHRVPTPLALPVSRLVQARTRLPSSTTQSYTARTLTSDFSSRPIPPDEPIRTMSGHHDRPRRTKAHPAGAHQIDCPGLITPGPAPPHRPSTTGHADPIQVKCLPRQDSPCLAPPTTPTYPRRTHAHRLDMPS